MQQRACWCIVRGCKLLMAIPPGPEQSALALFCWRGAVLLAGCDRCKPVRRVPGVARVDRLRCSVVVLFLGGRSRVGLDLLGLDRVYRYHARCGHRPPRTPLLYMAQDRILQKKKYSNGQCPGGAIWTESSTRGRRCVQVPVRAVQVAVRVCVQVRAQESMRARERTCRAVKVAV